MKIKYLKDGIREDKGFILILALVTMLAMTLIGVSVVMNMTTDMQLARNDREAKLAFQLAEAGLREASARLHLASTKAKYIGEKPTDAGYRTTNWNANNALGRNFGSGMAGTAASVDNLNYTVTINYLTEDNPEGFCDSNAVGDNIGVGSAVPPAILNCSPAEVVMYGQDFNLSSNVTPIKYGTLPVYKLTSTGTSNGTSRTVVAYLGESNLNTDTQYAINTNGCVTKSGSASPTITGGIMQDAACASCATGAGTCATKATGTDMTTYLADSLTNIATYADQVHSCTNANCTGPGNDIPSSGKLDPVVTNWGSIGANEGSLIFINNSGGKDVSITGNIDGEGILIITGNLNISGTVKWEGLIYVLGTLTVSGNVNVEGGIMAGSAVQLNGSAMTLKYSLEELQEMARQTSTSATAVWKRL